MASYSSADRLTKAQRAYIRRYYIRKAPTPVLWHRPMEPWFAQVTSAEQAPLLETPELAAAGSDRRVWK